MSRVDDANRAAAAEFAAKIARNTTSGPTLAATNPAKWNAMVSEHLRKLAAQRRKDRMIEDEIPRAMSAADRMADAAPVVATGRTGEPAAFDDPNEARALTAAGLLAAGGHAYRFTVESDDGALVDTVELSYEADGSVNVTGGHAAATLAAAADDGYLAPSGTRRFVDLTSDRAVTRFLNANGLNVVRVEHEWSPRGV
jgi:hypothetical protein